MRARTCRSARLAIRCGASDCKVARANEATAAHVELTFDPAGPESLHQNAALVPVRECLDAIRAKRPSAPVAPPSRGLPCALLDSRGLTLVGSLGCLDD